MGGILIARRGDDARPEADAHDVPATAPLAIADDPAPYRIVYLVEDLGPTTAVRPEGLPAARPFRSRVEPRAGRPPGAPVQSVQASTFGHQQNGGPGREA